MIITVDIQGLKGVEDALADAGPKLAKRSLRKALEAAADPIIKSAKAHAPVMKEATTQRRPGELRDSIDKRIKMSTREEAGIAVIGPRMDKGEGSQTPGVWGMFEEFGSIHNSPQPYMRPAWDGQQTTALERFTQVMKDGVESLKR